MHRSVSDLPLIPENIEEANALELLSWVDGMRVTEPLAANFSFPHQSNPSINNSDISS
jgi:hypothetical protein